MEKDYGHKPVLLDECLDALAIRPDGVYLDGTLGRAGHSLEILRRLTTGRLIGVDRDLTAIEAAKERLAEFGDRVTLVGTDGEETITMEQVAAAADSFNYEFVCGISRRVPRIYVSGGEKVHSVHYLTDPFE